MKILGAAFFTFLFAFVSGCGDDDPAGPGDATPPAAVTDLRIVATSDTTALLLWTAPGDDGEEGTATRYDIRYSATELDSGEWWDSTGVALDSVPAPEAAGEAETLAVALPDTSTRHLYALKTADGIPNWSDLSNIARIDDSSRTFHRVAPDGSGHYPNIQTAVIFAADGDTIELEDGTYRGIGNRDIYLLGKDLLIRSRYGAPAKCVIDCEGGPADPNRALYFMEGEGPETVIERITLAGAYSEDDGGAVLCDGASPAFRRCVFSSNESGEYGGAVACVGGSAPKFEDCGFAGNVAERGGAIYCGDESEVDLDRCSFRSDSAHAGGAVYCDDESEVKGIDTDFSDNGAVYGGAVLVEDDSRGAFSGCVFRGNEAGGDSSGIGGAVYGFDSSRLVMVECTVTDNHARGEESGGGGVVCRSESEGEFDGCLFTANGADGEGGGLLFDTDCPSKLTDCVIAGNTSGTSGGGILCINNSPPTVHGCTVTANVSDWYGGGVILISTGGDFVRTILWGNEAENLGDQIFVSGGDQTFNCCAVDSAGVEGVEVPAEGNVTIDPLFVDPASGDYRLGPDSPCLPENREADECGTIGALGPASSATRSPR